MKILFIGSSNLILQNGISEKIPYFLSIAGLPAISSITNLSVGGTGSLFGWERVTRLEENDYNLIIIDYGITDLFIKENDHNLWKEGFKGLIRQLKSRFPHALIANILLGRRDASLWNQQTRLHKEMSDISFKHGVHTIDVDTHLKQKELSEVFPLLYKDDNHYIAPLGVNYVAQFCALQLINLLRNQCNFAPPLKDDEQEIKLHVTPFTGKKREFVGTRFHWTAFKLMLNEQVTMQVPGVPIGISFVSTAESCSLYIRANQIARIANTATAWTQMGLFPFIVTHTPIHGMWHKGMLCPTSSCLELRGINSHSSLWDESLVQNHGYPEGRADSLNQENPQLAGVFLDAITSWTWN